MNRTVGRALFCLHPDLSNFICHDRSIYHVITDSVASTEEAKASTSWIKISEIELHRRLCLSSIWLFFQHFRFTSVLLWSVRWTVMLQSYSQAHESKSIRLVYWSAKCLFFLGFSLFLSYWIIPAHHTGTQPTFEPLNATLSSYRYAISSTSTRK